MLFDKALRHFTTAGTLKLADAGGRVFAFEGGPGPRFAVRLTDPSLNRKFLVNPWLSIGEAYTDGTLVIEEGRLGDLLEYLCRNGRSHEHNPVLALSRWIDQRTRRLQQFNTLRRSHRNVAHHYDLSADLYRLFLGNDLQYSCGYFTSPDDTLEQAQHNKQRHIAAKLLPRPGHRVLDIGSGWGGLCPYLAQLTDIQLTGVTLSSEQYEIAALRARKAGLTDRVRFCLHDYRDEHGHYDRIVSVGMFEHVGATHYRQFFAKLRELLADGGICLLHSIFRMDPPSNTNA